MRITFVAPPVNMSGGIRVIVIYARHLARMGHEVQVVSPPPPKLLFRRKFASLLQNRCWPSDEISNGSHFDGSGVKHDVLEQWRPVTDSDLPDGDVVIATWWETAEWVHKLKANKGAKAYFIQHHEIFSYLPVERARATYRMPLHKIVVARWLQDIMRREYGDDTVDCVPNAVNHDQFFAPPRGKQIRPTVGFLYHSSIPKGVDLVLELIPQVTSLFPNLRIISFGTEKPNKNLPLPKGTEFVFNPPQTELRKLYSQCDVWLSASRTEGFNLPALEAMACRTPVVSTTTGWPEDAIKTGWNGVLVPIDDVAGLAQGLKFIFSRSDPDWRELSSNAYATAAPLSWDKSAAMFENALRHACIRAQHGEIAGNDIT